MKTLSLTVIAYLAGKQVQHLHRPVSEDEHLCTLQSRFPLYYLEEIPALFGTFQDPLNVLSRTLCTARVLLNLLYTASSTANTVDQVHCTHRYNTHTYYIWDAKYFNIYCHFVSVSNSPNLALHMLVNLNHNSIPGISL